ncbi:MAG: hypothetical protein Q8W46_09105, partial [Candidatus Palauibacterales bacterium]|nr:hypothetical protein [Candidatus Palauibacterales bacterium]
DGVLTKIYPDLWLNASRPVAFEPVFLEARRRRLPAANNLRSLYMTGGKARAAVEEFSGPDVSPADRIWKAVSIDGWVRPAPREQLEKEFVPGACGPPAEGPTHCLIGLGMGLTDLGKTDALAAMLSDLRDAAAAARDAGDEDRAENRQQIVDALDAYGRARTGDDSDRAAAIADLRDLQGKGSVADPWMRWWLGELLLEDGQLRDAAVYFEATRRGYLNSLANFRLGGIYTELGEREKARAAYIRFLQAWEEADPDLPQLETARTALEDLLAG